MAAAMEDGATEAEAMEVEARAARDEMLGILAERARLFGQGVRCM